MEDATARQLESCRICASRDLALVLDLGSTPLANAFVAPERAAEPELRFPLEVLQCGRCRLVQLSVVVRPDVLFRTYLYSSSASAPMVEHFDRLAAELAQRFALPGACVVEVGSNDGVLLARLAARGVRAVGVEPAANLAAIANARGLETWNEFFSADSARRVLAAKGPAAVVVANNVLAHIDDLGAMLRALDVLLARDGVFAAEVPYLGDLLEHVEYDTIYHEHLSYFALAPLRTLLASGGLEVFDVERLPVHGGSVRVFAGRAGRHAGTERLARALEGESAAGLTDRGRFVDFATRVQASREALRRLLSELRGAGRRLAGYGATAKSTTLLSFCGIGAETLAFIADTTPLKQGLLTPGTHIPILPDDALLAERPDYTLLLAWNYADAIMRGHASYLAAGGRFVHPMPLARIL